MITACNNIPFNEGRTVILSDNSGSMYGDVAGKSLILAMSSRKSADIANLLNRLRYIFLQPITSYKKLAKRTDISKSPKSLTRWKNT